jgi:small subunit ribosomal protein S16
MPVRIRLARFGRHLRPFYRIVATDSRNQRDGRFLERLGHYDPLPNKEGVKDVVINVDRTKYWLSVGAQPSDTVRRLLGYAGVLPKMPVPSTQKQEKVAKDL